jgi:hypothetical protein
LARALHPSRGKRSGDPESAATNDGGPFEEPGNAGVLDPDLRFVDDPDI